MRYLRRPGGFYGTAAVAGVLATMGVLATPWAGLFHMGWPGGLATVVGTLMIAAGLLRRWRPMRTLVLAASGINVIASTAVGLLAGQPGPLIMAAGSAANLLILMSRPVRRYFDATSAAVADAPPPSPAGAEPVLLPMERAEPGVGGAVRSPAGVRATPEERGAE